MTQDFAKIRPEPLLEKKQVEAPPAWSLMLTGIMVGISIGVLACFLLYMSGKVPPLTAPPVQASLPPAGTPAVTAEPEQETGAPLELEFYEELANYEVPVPDDLVPVTIVEPPGADDPLAHQTMLQTGAFQQQERAYNEMNRLRSLGLQADVRSESSLPGRTLFLVQAGPYGTVGSLRDAEQVLRANNIRSMRLELR